MADLKYRIDPAERHIRGDVWFQGVIFFSQMRSVLDMLSPRATCEKLRPKH